MSIRLIFLWHMHQPYYKDLVSGEYRLPWTRLHALKDYYGMVKLADEFPSVHQTFNLVPSLITQIEDYVAGAARDPFLEVAAKPAEQLSPEERRFALQYLFQANPIHMIGRYPRYRELWQQFRTLGENLEKADRVFHTRDFADLQVLSQLAWFDEFFLADPEIAALVRKGSGFTVEDQRLVIAKEKEILAAVLPAYTAAARKGTIEISTSPFYHPILPLLCDSDAGRVSTAGLPLPQQRFRHPEDAEEQLVRGLELHQRVFGMPPRGAWPSEGSVSDEVLVLGHKVGLSWMATDEGVLARSLGQPLARDAQGHLTGEGPEKLYTIYRYEHGGAQIHLLFRDHSLSDLIGFVYAGMSAKEAAQHLIQRIKEAAEPLVKQKKTAVVSVILDGENAWEYYPESGREFLRRLYDAIARDPAIEALTVSEAIARQREFGHLKSVTPGSWINADFRVWIGAPEDNRAWDYLYAARQFYSEAAPNAAEDRRRLAFEEVLIAEGSDWNWWYGPEHHSANDRDFDELYRKHLSNVYQALGAAPPDYLAQPIAAGVVRPYFVPQTAYIHPRLEGVVTRYFDWIGAAMYTADRRSSAMHGKQFVLGAVYAGINESHVYGRLDFSQEVPANSFELVVNLERVPAAPAEKAGAKSRVRKLRLSVSVEGRAISAWKLTEGEKQQRVVPADSAGLEMRLLKVFEFKLPLALLGITPGDTLRLRFSLWRERLPIDALPLEGWIELQAVSDEELRALAY